MNHQDALREMSVERYLLGELGSDARSRQRKPARMALLAFAPRLSCTCAGGLPAGHRGSELHPAAWPEARGRTRRDAIGAEQPCPCQRRSPRRHPPRDLRVPTWSVSALDRRSWAKRVFRLSVFAVLTRGSGRMADKDFA